MDTVESAATKKICYKELQYRDFLLHVKCTVIFMLVGIKIHEGLKVVYQTTL